MCYGEHTSPLGKFGAWVVMWPVSQVGHPGAAQALVTARPGWLMRYLARLSRLQVREARLMCYGEHTSQLDKFGAWVVIWPVSTGKASRTPPRR